MAKIKWSEIKNDYVTDINGEKTIESLSEKHCASVSSITKKCASEGWVQLREEYCKKVEENLKKKAAEKHAKKLFESIEFCEIIENHLKRHFIGDDNLPLKGKISTKQLKEITESLAINIKIRRLLLGEPESIIKNNHSGSVDLEFSEKEIEDELDELMGIKKRVNDRQKKAAKAEGSDKDTEEEDS